MIGWDDGVHPFSVRYTYILYQRAQQSRPMLDLHVMFIYSFECLLSSRSIASIENNQHVE